MNPAAALRMLSILAIGGCSVGCDQRSGPALDPSRIVISGIALGTKLTDAMPSLQTSSRRSDAEEFQQNAAAVPGVSFGHLAGYGLFSTERPYPQETMIVVFSSSINSSRAVGIYHKFDFQNGTSSLKPKPRATEMLEQLIEKFGFPTANSANTSQKGELIASVMIPKAYTTLTWISSADNMKSLDCRFATSAVEDLGLPQTQLALDAGFARVFDTATSNSNAYRCGPVLTAKLLTSSDRDTTAELVIAAVDSLAADSAKRSDVKAHEAQTDKGASQQRTGEGQAPHAPAPRF